MILRGSLWLTLIGILFGAPFAILISRALASSLYQVKPFDATSYIAAILCLACVARCQCCSRTARRPPRSPKALRSE